MLSPLSITVWPLVDREGLVPVLCTWDGPNPPALSMETHWQAADKGWTTLVQLPVGLHEIRWPEGVASVEVTAPQVQEI